MNGNFKFLNKWLILNANAQKLEIICHCISIKTFLKYFKLKCI